MYYNILITVYIYIHTPLLNKTKGVLLHSLASPLPGEIQGSWSFLGFFMSSKIHCAHVSSKVFLFNNTPFLQKSVPPKTPDISRFLECFPLTPDVQFPKLQTFRWSQNLGCFPGLAAMGPGALKPKWSLEPGWWIAVPEPIGWENTGMMTGLWWDEEWIIERIAKNSRD